MQLRHLLMAAAFLYGAQSQAQTATSSRLIATAASEHNSAVFVLRDTSFMTYTNDRGGDLTHELKFDKRVNLIYNPNTGGYSPQSQYTQTFDSNSNMLSYMEEQYDAPSSSYNKYVNYLHTYDEQNNMLTHIVQFWNNNTQQWHNSSKILYFYNGDQVLDTTVTQFWNGSSVSWVNSTMAINSFDLDGNLVIETNFYWDGVSEWSNNSRKVYNYKDGEVEQEINQYWNNFNNSWTNSSRHQYVYNGDGDLLSDVTSVWLSGTGEWRNMNKVSHVYNAGNMQSQLMQNWNMGMANWQNVSQNVYLYDTSDNNSIEMQQAWVNNSFRNTVRFDRIYNEHGQMTTERQQSWNIGGFWENTDGDMYNRYYYQTHTLDVPVTVAENNTNLSLYPVPAGNLLTIEAGWKQPQDFVVIITDMTGRLVRQWSEKASANYRKTIPVGNMANGNYFLVIKSNGEQTVKQFAIMH